MNSENYIYKFLPPDRLSYFEDELLRITQPADLNDPFECIPILPTVEETIRLLEGIHNKQIIQIKESRLLKSEKKEKLLLLERTIKSEITSIRKNIKSNMRDKFRSYATNRINEIVGILSLSRRWDSSLMWSHYSNSHKGFCLGFSSKASYFSDYKDNAAGDILFRPVKYSDLRIKAAVSSDEKFDSALLITKPKDWEYEEEERLLVRLTRANKIIKNSPFDIFLFKVPHYLLKEIILGKNISETIAKKIKDYCTGKDIKIFQSQIDEYKFDMTRTEI